MARRHPGTTSLNKRTRRVTRRFFAVSSIGSPDDTPGHACAVTR
jgi:hypothetical protein